MFVVIHIYHHHHWYFFSCFFSKILLSQAIFWNLSFNVLLLYPFVRPIYNKNMILVVCFGRFLLFRYVNYKKNTDDSFKSLTKIKERIIVLFYLQLVCLSMHHILQRITFLSDLLRYFFCRYCQQMNNKETFHKWHLVEMKAKHFKWDTESIVASWKLFFFFDIIVIFIAPKIVSH